MKTGGDAADVLGDRIEVRDSVRVNKFILFDNIRGITRGKEAGARYRDALLSDNDRAVLSTDANRGEVHRGDGLECIL